MIAIAPPPLLIADGDHRAGRDHPAQIMELMLARPNSAWLMFISHDLAAAYADEVS